MWTWSTDSIHWQLPSLKNNNWIEPMHVWSCLHHASVLCSGADQAQLAASASASVLLVASDRRVLHGFVAVFFFCATINQEKWTSAAANCWLFPGLVEHPSISNVTVGNGSGISMIARPVFSGPEPMQRKSELPCFPTLFQAPPEPENNFLPGGFLLWKAVKEPIFWRQPFWRQSISANIWNKICAFSSNCKEMQRDATGSTSSSSAKLHTLPNPQWHTLYRKRWLPLQIKRHV